MSKAEGKKIGIKFTETINEIVLLPTLITRDAYESPTGIVTGSSQYSADYPSNAFDGNISTSWRPLTTTNEWIKIELAEPMIISGFRWTSLTSSYRPRLFTVSGSNDGVSWVELYSGESPMVSDWKEFQWQPIESYKYYRWDIASGWATAIRVYELELLFVDVSLQSGNENAFTITGQEYEWVDGPSNNGEIVNKTYPVSLVQTHPSEPNSIQMDVSSIRNSIGALTVTYDQALGNLSGIGGAVENFTESFNPIDLQVGLTDYSGFGMHDHIEASVTGDVLFIKILKSQAVADAEYISASVSGIIEMINIEDINP